jgi:hypothetical protein
METITLSQVKARLGRIVDQAIRTGQPVIGRRGTKFFQIAPWEPMEPLNYRPVGKLPVSKLAMRLEKLAGPVIGPDDV